VLNNEQTLVKMATTSAKRLNLLYRTKMRTSLANSKNHWCYCHHWWSYATANMSRNWFMSGCASCNYGSGEHV